MSPSVRDSPNLGYVDDGNQRHTGTSHFPRIDWPVRDNTTDGAENPGVGKLHSESVHVRLSRIHLRLRAPDRLLPADAVERLQMLLCRLQLDLRLDHLEFGFIYLSLRQSSFLLERDPAVVQFLGGVERALCRLHIRLCLGLIFDYGRARHRRIRGLRLFVLKLGFFYCRRQIATFQLGDQLSGANVISAIDQYAFHWSADLGSNVGLIDREQNGVGSHYVVDRTERGVFNQDRRRGFRLGRFLFSLAASGEQRDGDDHTCDRYFIFVGHSCC